MSPWEKAKYKEDSFSSPLDVWHQGDSLRKEFLVQRLQIQFNTSQSAISVNLINAIILVAVLWGGIPASHSLTWLASLTILLAARIWLGREFEASEEKVEKATLWTGLYTAGIFLSAVIWGIAGVLYFTEDFSMQLLFACFMISGMCAGGLAVLSSIRAVAYSYIIPIMTPITICFFASSGVHHVMGVLCIIFTFMCFTTVKRTNQSISRALALQFENAELVEFYKSEKENAEKLNSELSGEIERRRIIEKELEDTAKVAQEASKAKSEFLANMSHEIRTPMNAIIGISELLLEAQPADSEKELLDTIKHSAESLMRILNDVLDFSKIETKNLDIKFAPTELRELIYKMQSMMSSEAQKREISFKCSISDELPKGALLDSVRVQQVLTNLVGNALKYTDAGGSVTVECRKLVVDGEMEKILFEVYDTGIGIAEDERDKIFESFYQADNTSTRAYGGTGLGLAISNRLVNLMQGEISCRSNEKKGSVFSFWLPLIPVKKESETTWENNTPSVPETESTFQPLNILVAEDNPVNQKVARAILESAGHQVNIVANGEEAMEANKNNSFDLILMDIQMPTMDGYTAAQNIRLDELDTNKRVPMIALTANAQPKDKKKCLECGMDDYISKPIKREVLIQIVEHYGAQDKV